MIYVFLIFVILKSTLGYLVEMVVVERAERLSYLVLRKRFFRIDHYGVKKKLPQSFF